MNASDLLTAVATYYTGRLREHGTTPRGVDWNSTESQERRFEQLLRVCDPSEPVVLGDYGCGYGALYAHLLNAGFDGGYRGFDIAPAMLEAARLRFDGDARPRFGMNEDVLADANYVIASGVFNVKLQTPTADWEAYVYRT